MNNLALIFFPAYDWSLGPDHPEREERLLYTHDQLMEDGIFDYPNIREYKPQQAQPEDILKAHISPLPLNQVAGLSHLISAGGAITAAKLIMEKKANKAFALVRPPGHHAMKMIYGGRGFCNINNEAIMVEYLREQYSIKKIAIIDTDCHHGDGTQDIYWHDPDILFISLHQDGRTLYPGTGFTEEIGGPQAMGSTINIPLPPQTGDEGLLWAVKNFVLPYLNEWKPDLIINSAGQDNHFSDPITNMKITAKGYAQLSELLQADIAVLEGGYAIKGALPYTNLGIIMSMAGLDWNNLYEPLPSPNSLVTSSKNMDIIKKNIDCLRKELKASDPYKRGYQLENGWWVRERQIFHESGQLSAKDLWSNDKYPPIKSKFSYGSVYEHQLEQLKNCSNCSGLLIISSKYDNKINSYAMPTGMLCHKCQGLYEEFKNNKITI